MTKFLAAAHDPDSLLARRARLKGASAEDTREIREEPKARAAEPALDPEMLDLVTRFEQNFAELAPVREEPQNAALSDDLFPEFPDTPFDAPAVRSRPRALELARIEPQVTREPSRVGAPRADMRSTALDEQVDIDEAFSILKAAETAGAAKAQQAAEDARAAAERTLPPTDVQPDLRQEYSRSRTQSSSAVERTDWASRSHRPRSIAVGAGVLVLALGLTVGYVAGRMPIGKSHAVIQITQQGGTVLRLDTNFGKR